MSRYVRRLPAASLHLMAFGWSAAVIVTLTALIRQPLPPVLLVLAYLLPALLRPRSPGLGVAAAVVVAAASALFVPLADVFFTVLFLLAQSARPLTLSRHPTVTFLRQEQRRGLALILLTVLVRAVAGRPDIWLLALLVLVYLAGALVGLPLAHSQEASAGSLTEAKPGLQTGLVIGGAAAVLAAIIGAVHLAVQAHAFDFLGPVFAWLFQPIAYVVGYIVQFFVGALLGHRAHLPPQQKQSARPGPLHIPHHHYSHAFMQHLEIAVIAIAVILVATIIYWLYRRQQVREAADLQDPNAPAGGTLERGAAPRPRRGEDYGEGARRIVRRTVGLHLRGQAIPPGMTVRGYGRDRGWDEDLIQAYEHARYGFVDPFPESKAHAFVAGFVRRFGRRGRTGKDGGRG